MDDHQKLKRMAAALRVQAEAKALCDDDETAGIGERWFRRIDEWLKKDEYAPHDEVEERRDRTEQAAKKKGLDVSRLLNLIDKLIPYLTVSDSRRPRPPSSPSGN